MFDIPIHPLYPLFHLCLVSTSWHEILVITLGEIDMILIILSYIKVAWWPRSVCQPATEKEHLLSFVKLMIPLSPDSGPIFSFWRENILSLSQASMWNNLFSVSMLECIPVNTSLFRTSPLMSNACRIHLPISGLHLIILPNVPGAMFIPGSRVMTKSCKLVKTTLSQKYGDPWFMGLY